MLPAVVRDRRPKGWAINACSLDLGPRRRVSAKASARKPASRHEAGCGLMPPQSIQRGVRSSLSSERRRVDGSSVGDAECGRRFKGAERPPSPGGVVRRQSTQDADPWLRIPQSQVEATVQTHLQKAVGEQKAAEIWSDPAGKGSMLAWGWHDALECSHLYVHQDPGGERPGQQRHSGNAAFDVEVEYAPGNSGAVDFPKDDLITVHEFTYATAENTHDFSWNAMAKAPAGYFRSEPILGVASRPPPAVVVIEDLDENSIEVRNRLSPGSKETHQFGSEPAPGRGKPSVGRCGRIVSIF